MKATHHFRSPASAGFTLVELMVSSALIAVVAGLVFSLTASTSAIWRRTTGSVEQFRGANLAFEAMTRRLSQATLNTYWDYSPKPPAVPTKYVRESDLRFLTGKMETIMTLVTPHRPTHAVFFQAPTGYVSNTANFGGLENLLNLSGYYIEFSDDLALRPPFITTAIAPPRSRYRLMELLQPSESLNVYKYTLSSIGGTYNRKDWVQAAVVQKPSLAHVLADNVIALIIQPKLSKKDEVATGKVLTKDYTYDTTNTAITDPDINPKNQLPPVVQVTLVAIDEPSAAKIANGTIPPAFDTTLNTLFTDTAKYDADVTTLQQTLNSQRISYRVFTSNVGIRAAKWSRK